jgi:glycosyltransferase involved in cell wall biosynthesis
MTNNKIKVSVLMPVYNASLFLKEAIDSILAQTLTEFELLIINDGSTDNSEMIVDGYKDMRIKHVKLPINGGIVNALNVGLDLAQGEYIARMDADDIAIVNRLEIQTKFMDDNPVIGAAGSWVTYFGVKSGLIKTPAVHQEILWTLLSGSALFHPTVIFRASVVRNLSIKYPDDYPHAEDYAMWIELSKKIKLANIQESLLNYRWTDTSITSVHSTVQHQSAEKLRKKMHEILLGEKIPDEIWRTINCDTNYPLNIPNVIHIYSLINGKHNLFPASIFKQKLRKRIGVLIITKGIDNSSRMWLLKHSYKHISYLRYFVRSFLGNDKCHVLANLFL